LQNLLFGDILALKKYRVQYKMNDVSLESCMIIDEYLYNI